MGKRFKAIYNLNKPIQLIKIKSMSGHGTSFFESKTWKNIMKYVYGLGAAVVIMGALFKIMYWPGASEMLIVGLSTEAIIFVMSGF